MGERDGEGCQGPSANEIIVVLFEYHFVPSFAPCVLSFIVAYIDRAYALEKGGSIDVDYDPQRKLKAE
jgi:hypothetical protein